MVRITVLSIILFAFGFCAGVFAALSIFPSRLRKRGKVNKLLRAKSPQYPRRFGASLFSSRLWSKLRPIREVENKKRKDAKKKMSSVGIKK